MSVCPIMNLEIRFLRTKKCGQLRLEKGLEAAAPFYHRMRESTSYSPIIRKMVIGQLLYASGKVIPEGFTRWVEKIPKSKLDAMWQYT